MDRWDGFLGPAGFRAAALFAAVGFAAAFFRGPLVLDLPVSDFTAFAMTLPGCFLEKRLCRPGIIKGAGENKCIRLRPVTQCQGDPIET